MATRAEREKLAARKQRARERYVERTYGITPEQQAILLTYQGGRCHGCGRATGARKALACDHDHKTGEVRMFLCGPCNQVVVGQQFRDNAAGLIRLGLALSWPPSRVALAAPGRELGWGDPEYVDMIERL